MCFRCRTLRTPGNILVANLALSDFLMLSKTPIFIFNSFNLGPALGKTGNLFFLSWPFIRPTFFPSKGQKIGRKKTFVVFFSVTFLFVWGLNSSNQNLLRVFSNTKRHLNGFSCHVV